MVFVANRQLSTARYYPIQSESDPKGNRDEADEGGPQHHLKRGRHIAMMRSRHNDGKDGSGHRCLKDQHGFEGEVQRRNLCEEEDERGQETNSDGGRCENSAASMSQRLLVDVVGDQCSAEQQCQRNCAYGQQVNRRLDRSRNPTLRAKSIQQDRSRNRDDGRVDCPAPACCSEWPVSCASAMLQKASSTPR